METEQQKEERCRKTFYAQGVRGGLFWGAVSLVTVTILPMLSPTIRRAMKVPGKAFIVSSAMLAGGWIRAENALFECAREVPPNYQKEEKGYPGEL